MSWLRGWLFDYEFEWALKDEPVVSRRWRFRGVYKIDEPLTAEAKRDRIERILADVNGM
jgi:hypothetical protein